MKVIEIPNDKDYLIDLTKKEIENLIKLSNPSCSPFVVCYYDYHYDENNRNFYIEMEMVRGFNLEAFEKVPAELFRNNLDSYFHLLLLIASDISKGLLYTHDKNILHNDIKPANIMVDMNLVPRIIDYGMSCNILKNEKSCDHKGGTPHFIPPEYFTENGKRYPESDMWALGVSLYKLASGRYPVEVKGRQLAWKGMEIKPLNTRSRVLNHVVNRLLTIDRKNRMTPRELIQYVEKNAKKPKNFVKFMKALFSEEKTKDPDLLKRPPTLSSAEDMPYHLYKQKPSGPPSSISGYSSSFFDPAMTIPGM